MDCLLNLKIACDANEKEQILSLNKSVPLSEQIKSLLLFCAKRNININDLIMKFEEPPVSIPEEYYELRDFCTENECTLKDLIDSFSEREYRKFQALMEKEREYQRQDNEKALMEQEKELQNNANLKQDDLKKHETLDDLKEEDFGRYMPGHPDFVPQPETEVNNAQLPRETGPGNEPIEADFDFSKLKQPQDEVSKKILEIAETTEKRIEEIENEIPSAMKPQTNQDQSQNLNKSYDDFLSNLDNDNHEDKDLQQNSKSDLNLEQKKEQEQEVVQTPQTSQEQKMALNEKDLELNANLEEEDSVDKKASVDQDEELEDEELKALIEFRKKQNSEKPKSLFKKFFNK